MSVLFGFLVAAGAITAVDIYESRKLAGIAETELERIRKLTQGVPATFEDGTFSEGEASFCREVFQVPEPPGSNPLAQHWFCATNPTDPRCVAVKQRAACERELGAHVQSGQDGAIVDTATGAVKGLVSGALGPIFTNIAWLAIAAGAVYFVVVRR